MGFFSQFSNVVEWKEWNDETIFYKFSNEEIKKGSKLIIRPGQDAIFLFNGKIEGIFTEDGEYDIESDIIPFLSSLKGFKFGFNSGMRAEVLFVNTRELEVKWGTKSPINIPTPSMPGGMPIRANGTFHFKINDYVTLIDKLAGIKTTYSIEDVRSRIISILDSLLMKWISQEGKDMFNLQANAQAIGKGIGEDLDMEILNDGMTVTSFNIMSFNYPKEIQDMINKNASHGMIGDMTKYSSVSMADGMSKNGSAAGDMASMMMGMNVAQNMVDNMNGNKTASQNVNSNAQASSPKFCPECGTKNPNSKFCPECGTKF